MKAMTEIPQNRISLSKLEVARRQLETAITMYFKRCDPVSTHTLATAALEVLHDINKSRNGPPMLSDLEASGVIRPDKLEIVRKAFRAPQNFFKHANTDPKGILDFNPEATAGFILDAVEKYRELTGENPPILRVFSLWFRVQWTEVFHFSNGEECGLAMARSLYTLDAKAKFFADFLPRYVAEASKIAPK